MHNDNGADFITTQPYWMASTAHADLENPSKVASEVCLGGLNLEDGAQVIYAPVFTDEDLCSRFVEMRQRKGAKLFSFTFERPQQFIDVLRALEASGTSNVGFDLEMRGERAEVRILPIARVIATMLSQG